MTDIYSKENLLGQQVFGIVNFPAKQIGPCMSAKKYGEEPHSAAAEVNA